MHPSSRSGLYPLDHKMQSKTALQEELHWPVEPKRPMLCLPSGMTDALGGKLFEDVLPGILSLPVELLVLGKGSASYGTLFTKLAKEQRHRVHIVADKDKALDAMLAASDMALFLSKEISAHDLTQCLQHGVVPISLPHAHLEDYNPVQETGNAFLYDSPTKWHCFAALTRAVETHKFPFDWKTIQRHCQEAVR